MLERARGPLTVILVTLSVLAAALPALAHDALPGANALTGEVHLERDLRIAAGDALEVGPGTVFKGPGRVLAYGQLTVHGNATAPVVFRTPVWTFPGSNVTVHDASFTTPGVTSLDVRGGRVVVRDAAFTSGVAGVRVEAPPGDAGRVDVRDVTFRNVTTGVLVTGAGSTRVVNASFDGAFVGVDVTLGPGAPARVRVEDAWFRESVARVTVVDDAHAEGRVTVTGSTFEARSLDAGESAAAGRAAFAVDVLGGNASSDHEAVTSRGNAFLGHEVGFAVHAPAEVADAGPRVTSSRDAFEGNAVGVRVANARVTLTEPTFQGNVEWDVHAPGALGTRVTLEDAPAAARVLSGPPVAPAPAPAAPAGNALALVAGGLLVLGLAAGAALPAAAARALPLVARVLPARARDAAARERVRAYVTTHPGVPAARVAHATDLPVLAVRAHARALERDGALLVQRAASGRALYHARLEDAPAPDADAPAPVAVRGDARDPPSLTRAERDVLAAVLAHEGSTQSALADVLGTTRQAVHYQVKKLVRAGLVTKVPHGRETRLYARDEARAALDAAQET